MWVIRDFMLTIGGGSTPTPDGEDLDPRMYMEEALRPLNYSFRDSRSSISTEL